MARGDGDRLVRCARGHVHWGRYGAAGLLLVHGGPDGEVLLQHRSRWTFGGNRWALFGGARDSDEDAVTAALREVGEESTLDPSVARPHGLLVEDHGRWSYTTVVATADTRPKVEHASRESKDAAWCPVAEVPDLPLYPPFAAAWPRLLPCLARPVLVVDCANVMGARADGWWKDRKGAATRLRDDLAALSRAGVPGLGPFDLAYPEILLVTEGKARGIGSVDGVTVVDAPASGDDAIVAMVRGQVDTTCVVVTADRELRGRCAAAGGSALGPRWLLDRLGPPSSR